MTCLKCGREIEEDQVFCPKCLELNERIPVPMTTIVRLPVRNTPGKKQPQRKKPPTVEEKLELSRRICKILAILLTVLLLTLAGTSWALAVKIREDQKPLPGQNYSTVTTPTESTAAP